MIPAISALKNPKLLVVAGYVILLAALLFLWNSNGSLNQDIGRLKTVVAQAELANERMVSAFDSAAQANKECNDLWQKSETDSKTAIAKLQRRYNRLKVKHTNAEQTLQEIFSEETCEKVGSLNVADACPALANSLRSAATAISRDTHRDN